MSETASAEGFELNSCLKPGRAEAHSRLEKPGTKSWSFKISKFVTEINVNFGSFDTNSFFYIMLN